MCITQVKSVLFKHRKATVNNKITGGDVLYLLRGCRRYFVQCASDIWHGLTSPDFTAALRFLKQVYTSIVGLQRVHIRMVSCVSCQCCNWYRAHAVSAWKLYRNSSGSNKPIVTSNDDSHGKRRELILLVVWGKTDHHAWCELKNETNKQTNSYLTRNRRIARLKIYEWICPN